MYSTPSIKAPVNAPAPTSPRCMNARAVFLHAPVDEPAHLRLELIGRHRRAVLEQ
jgi:hypothetical protein